MQLNTRALAWAAAWTLVIFYLVCIVLWGFAFANTIDVDVHQKLLGNLYPGFVWLTAGSFIWGLILSFVYGLLAGWIFGSIYNYHCGTMKPARRRR